MLAPKKSIIIPNKHLKRQSLCISPPKNVSPIKFIRKDHRKTSSCAGSPILKTHGSQTCIIKTADPHHIDETIQLLSQIRNFKPIKKKLIMMRSCSLILDNKQQSIQQTIDQIAKLAQSKDDLIGITLKQLFEERKQKDQAVRQSQSLLKQQEWQIAQLTSEIENKTVSVTLLYTFFISFLQPQLMNIVRTNFMDNLPLMQKAIRDAAFVSFDLEFSGVLASPLLRNSFLDSQQMRYWKQKENIGRFIPLQLGLCTFKEEGDSYLAHPFNIYLFPFALDGYLDKRFVFSSASIAFLSDNGFDFNKTFQEGVFYLSHQDEAILKETKKLNDLRKDLRYRDKVVSHEMKAQYALFKPQIEKFLQSQNTEIEFDISFFKPKVVTYIIEMAHKEFPIDKFYVRFDTEIFFRRNKLFLVKGEESIEKQVEIDSVADYAGVRVLMDQISDQKTPIIVHNGLLDIFHLYDKLYYQLPENLLDFKQNFRKVFPNVYDTKYIINQSYHLFSKVNHLSELKNSYQQLLSLEPSIVISQATPNYNRPGEESTFEHEAGYDAMMTGSIFLKAKRSLNDDVSCFKNRLPLGSIKVPFNLEQTEDLYHGPDTQIFHLLILEHRLLPETEVKKFFLEQFGGAVEIYLSYGVNFEYFITFHKQEICDKLISQLKEGKLILNIDNSQVVVSEYEAYTQTLQRRAKHELQVKEKPNNILE